VIEPWEQWLKETLGGMEKENLFRIPKVTKHGSSQTLFSTNDYLGLSQHPSVVDAAVSCWQSMGAGTRSSALIAGRSEHHDLLEQDLALTKGAESCLLFPSGYAANIGLLSAVADQDVEIFSDAGNHASLIDGCRLARSRGAQVAVYDHLDFDGLQALLKRSQAPRKLIVTDSLFSMTGEIADLPRLVDLAETYGAALAIDEAHASLIFGDQGGGIADRDGLSKRILFQTGTLSKAFGLLGGFVATTAEMKALLFNRARSQVFSTALPAPIAAAARVSMRLGAKASEPRRRLKGNLEFFAKETGLRVDGPIIAINLGSPARATKASSKFEELGMAVPAIRPPTVPENESRLRISLTASHTESEILSLCRSLTDLGLI
jgi:8-amino-7-oxononanoate synthase